MIFLFETVYDFKTKLFDIMVNYLQTLKTETLDLLI